MRSKEASLLAEKINRYWSVNFGLDAHARAVRETSDPYGADGGSRTTQSYTVRSNMCDGLPHGTTRKTLDGLAEEHWGLRAYV